MLYRLSVSGHLPYIVGVNVAVFASLVSEEPAALCIGAMDQYLVAVLPAVTVDDFTVGGLAHGQAGIVDYRQKNIFCLHVICKVVEFSFMQQHVRMVRLERLSGI